MDWVLVAERLDKIMAADTDKRGDLIRTLDADPDGITQFIQAQLQRESDTTFMSTSVGALNGAGDARYEPGDRIGPWKIESALGSGGMGSVYRAIRDDGTFEQLAALKVLVREDEDLARRFLDERQRLARLENPNIARIIDGGEDESGYPYMAIEYVDGRPIDTYCADTGASREVRLRLLEHLCEALAHSHARLIVHRDIKPANVLITCAGELRLIDFGISNELREGGKTGPGPLTFVTAAPEQLRAEPVTVATDIFHVGMLMHKLLTGAQPRRLNDGGVTVDKARLGNRDLGAIVSRALQTDPARRYATIRALADDLRNFRLGRAVDARQGGAGYAIVKAMTRHKIATGAIALGLAALIGGLGVSLWQSQQTLNARNLAEVEEARSDKMRESLYFLLAGSQEMASDNPRLDRASQQIKPLFAQDPARYASVLQALGELQLYISDYAGAQATYDLFIAHAEAIDSATLALGRYHLAQASYHIGDLDRSRETLAAAQAYWNTDPGRWRTRLIDSRLTEAQLLREEDPAAAITLLQTTLRDYEARYGAVSHRSGIFLNNIGAAEFARGDVEAAEAAFLQADAVWRLNGLGGGFDALNTLNNLASAQYLRGNSVDAADTFAKAVELREALFGPSAATAALLNNYGKVLTSLDLFEEALPVLERASSMSESFVGTGSILHVATLNGYSEALTRSGNSSGLAIARKAARLIADGNLPAPLAASNRLAEAKAMAASGEPETARDLLDEASELAAQSGPLEERIQKQIAGFRNQLPVGTRPPSVQP